MSNRTNPFYEKGDENKPKSLFNIRPTNNELHALTSGMLSPENIRKSKEYREQYLKDINTLKQDRKVSLENEKEEIQKILINILGRAKKYLTKQDFDMLVFNLENEKIKLFRNIDEYDKEKNEEEEKEIQEILKNRNNAIKFGEKHPFPNIPGGKKSRRKTKNKKSKKSKTRKMKKNKKSKSRRR